MSFTSALESNSHLGSRIAQSAAVWRSFTTDYFSARSAFVAAAQAAGANLERYDCPMPGPGGQTVSMDVAYIGDTCADKLLVVTSGVHGVEGFAGSAIQIDALLNQPRPSDVALLFVHAVNPWGMAWLVSDTEEGVDLNRNFLDYSAPLPGNPFYPAVDGFMACADLFGPGRDAAETERLAYLKAHDLATFACAVANGQHQFPGRFNYGGDKPCWSNTTLRRVLREAGGSAERVALVDVHSGYGNRGEGILLWDNRRVDDRASDRARRWWGDVTRLHSDEFLFKPEGAFLSAFPDMFAHAEVTATVLEFGTEPPHRVIEALRNGFWLMNFADASAAEQFGPAIRSELCACLAPNDYGWREAVLLRGREVIEQSVRGLAAA
jgi:Protein of unknown function (DUF2817)